MMKRTLTVFLLTVFSMPVLGGVADDGFLKAGEYGGLVTWRSYDPPLVVDGGGALEIQVRDNGCLFVESTSTPLSNLPPRGGVYDILLFNNAQLEYLEGVTELISVRTDNAITVLKGGTINNISSYQYGTTENIFIYAQKDSWSWIDNDKLKGIQGNWLADGSPFYIEFINRNGPWFQSRLDKCQSYSRTSFDVIARFGWDDGLARPAKLRMVKLSISE